jgi:hypothetical protein
LIVVLQIPSAGGFCNSAAGEKVAALYTDEMAINQEWTDRAQLGILVIGIQLTGEPSFVRLSKDVDCQRIHPVTQDLEQVVLEMFHFDVVELIVAEK